MREHTMKRNAPSRNDKDQARTSFCLVFFFVWGIRSPDKIQKYEYQEETRRIS